MNELTVVGNLRIYGTKEEPLFLAKDVAALIGHSDVSMMLKNIDDDEKLRQAMFVSGQNRQVWFLKEHGFYEVLMQSRKPIAKKFKKEVKEKLTELRKYGVTATNSFIETSINDPDYAIQMLKSLKEERQARIAAEEKNQIFFNNEKLLTATDIVSMLAKEQGITFLSAQQFNKEMQRLKILKNVNGEWQPTADKGMWLKEQGYLTYKDEIADNGFPLGVKVRYYASFVGYLIDNYYNQKEMFA